MFPSEAAVRQFLGWLRQHQLGRKRLLDTMLAATYRQAGIESLLTTNPSDFAVLGDFSCITPTATATTWQRHWQREGEGAPCFSPPFFRSVLIMQGNLNETKPFPTLTWRLKHGQRNLISPCLLFLHLTVAPPLRVTKTIR